MWESRFIFRYFFELVHLLNSRHHSPHLRYFLMEKAVIPLFFGDGQLRHILSEVLGQAWAVGAAEVVLIRAVAMFQHFRAMARVAVELILDSIL